MRGRASTGSQKHRHGGSDLLRRLLYVAFFVEVGLLLIVLPWSGFWERNYFLFAWPALEPVITNNFVRGAITGLGVVNLFAGFFELAPVFGSRERPPGSHDAAGPAGSERYPSAPDTQVEP